MSEYMEQAMERLEDERDQMAIRAYRSEARVERLEAALRELPDKGEAELQLVLLHLVSDVHICDEAAIWMRGWLDAYVDQVLAPERLDRPPQEEDQNGKATP